MMRATEIAVEREPEDTEPQRNTRRGGSHPGLLRIVERRLRDLAVDAPLVKADLDKIIRLLAQAIDAWRRAEDQKQRDDDWERTWLHTRYKGRILADIRGLADQDPDGKPNHDNIKAKEHFRRKGWKV